MKTRSGFVSVIGVPNAGKSTLANHIVGSKVSIISPKVQTTRTRINAIAMLGKTQVVLIDTPGIFSKVKAAKEQKKMHQSMVKSAYSSIQDADLILLLLDAKRGICDDTLLIADRIKKSGIKAALVINKIDAVLPPKLLEIAKKMNEIHNFDQTFMISALKGSGIKDLKKYLENSMPEGEFAFPEDNITDVPSRFLAAEVTREQVFNLFDNEIPYFTAVETASWKEDGKSITIHQNIYVLRESQKKIIVGKSGAGVKNIGINSRKQLNKIFGKKINLFLFVKIKQDWLEDKELAHLL